MLLRNEFSNLLSALFRKQHAGSNKSKRGNASRDYDVPLMQIVESRMSQKTRELNPLSLTERVCFASEVGPPPLTPATMRRFN